MSTNKTTLLSYSATALFVLLWSSGAIFSKIGLESASAFAFLLLRFAIAFVVVLSIALSHGLWLPTPGTRVRAAVTGLLMIGGYSICYFKALEHGVTPGVLATVLGVQPILTLLATESAFSLQRLSGLFLALSGLVLVVYHSIGLAQISATGVVFALAALGSITTGAILQKGVKQSPVAVLPLQYAMTLLLCLAFTPYEPLTVEFSLRFGVALVWLGVVISVVATLLLYRLIQAGNLVNVTSLFYLVPGVTAVMDYLFLGNQMSLLSLLGMAAILFGLTLISRTRQVEPVDARIIPVTDK
ncbi:Permease of the drug/metabolite transporter (DMT) superfamily [Hahella chejuensis KCTC 2396]|uniref:Permease of the drug/metabolite transporter (DMT) superfamily n=1 Tax=Hahella chejuensis (strain KCTC 2396) TaxID=349521 RepID=Q2SG06_HAHCH|nr:DMT family transporter [Hahella chejuensis]ABC30418.1 Permease of the drug/metabolite transporter (DMT) superfamily [Hahella chejuensis KCTC 2396]